MLICNVDYEKPLPQFLLNPRYTDNIMLPYTKKKIAKLTMDYSITSYNFSIGCRKRIYLDSDLNILSFLI